MENDVHFLLKEGVLVDRLCRLYMMISTCSRKEQGSYLILNEDSLFLVERIQAGDSLEDMIQAVMDHYESDYQQAQATIQEFLKTLMNYGYIREDTPRS